MGSFWGHRKRHVKLRGGAARSPGGWEIIVNRLGEGVLGWAAFSDTGVKWPSEIRKGDKDAGIVCKDAAHDDQLEGDRMLTRRKRNPSNSNKGLEGRLQERSFAARNVVRA